MNEQERIKQAIDFLRFRGVINTHADVADKLAASRSNVTMALNGNPRYLTKPFLKRFAAAYADYINEDWLLTGKGTRERIDPRSSRPHVPAELAVVDAGFVGAPLSSVPEGECEARPIMTPFPWYDFTIEVRGDSMLPELRSGDTIACEWLRPGASVHARDIYVVETAAGAVVKRIERRSDSLLCRSDNPAYAPFAVPADEVLRIARVVGLIRPL